MKVLLQALAVLATLAASLPVHAQAPMYAPLPASRELYSFADLYRLTVAAEWPLPAATAQAPGPLQVRAVARDIPAAAPAASYVFLVSPVASPQGGLLFLAGLAAAAWVARRRLGYAIRG
jgi:hypothetical protein